MLNKAVNRYYSSKIFHCEKYLDQFYLFNSLSSFIFRGDTLLILKWYVFRDLLSQLSHGSSHFKGLWRNIHGLEFPSARRYSVIHAKPPDFKDAGTHEAIRIPTILTSVCQQTDTWPLRTILFFARFHPLSCQ
jgi:hypothetical protein